METFLNQVAQLLGSFVPSLLGAILILVIGWLVAWLLASVVRRLLHRTKLDERISHWVRGDQMEEFDAEKWISRVIYYVAMLFVLIAFFQALGLTIVTQPLDNLLSQVFGFIPRVFAALVLLVIAWVVASVLRALLSRALKMAKLDERITGEADLDVDRVPISDTLGEVVYWLVFLLFLPTILNALALQGLLIPVQGLLNQVFGYLDNLFAAGLILAVGWFVARIVQRIVTNLLAAVGADHLSERVGLASVLGEETISVFLGYVVYVLILIPVVIASLNALALDAITQPATNMLDTVLSAIPAIFGAALILAIAYTVGRLVANLITKILSGVGFDGFLGKLGLRWETKEGGTTPSRMVGYLVLAAIMLFATIEALHMLNFALLAELISEFTVFAGQVILGLIIFALGLYLANLAARAVRNSDMSNAGLLSVITRVSILVLAGAMALRQMGLANEIINLAFGLLLGAIAVSVALAFGLGGREIAARELNKMVASISSQDEEQ